MITLAPTMTELARNLGPEHLRLGRIGATTRIASFGNKNAVFGTLQAWWPRLVEWHDITQRPCCVVRDSIALRSSLLTDFRKP